MNIAGSGVIPAGDFDEKISVSGSARFTGNLRCPALLVAGAASGTGNVECTGEVRASGSMRLNGSLSAQALHVSGAFRLEGGCRVETMKLAGAAHFGKLLKAVNIRADGRIHAEEGIEAETLMLRNGVLLCSGLLNAETAELDLAGGVSKVDSIGGTTICVKNAGGCETDALWRRLCNWISGHGAGRLEVAEAIEGETVTLEATCAPVVVGRDVTVGKDCEIGLIQYSGELHMDPAARVKRTEKL